MENNLEQKIKLYFASLPEALKEAILSADLPSKIVALSKRYNLHIDQSADLDTEINLVMIGLENAHDFRKNLEKNLNVPTDIAVKLASDVNETIFKGIRAELQKIQGNSSEPANSHDHESLDPNEILHGIENPSVYTPQAQKSNVSTVLPQQIAEENMPVTKSEILNIIEKPEVKEFKEDRVKVGNPLSIVDEKLSQVTTTPRIAEVRQAEISKGYAADPYREPIA